ncbi:hypothetical protein Cob_v002116 [Colletotrichum orbiculare MAFF 240422]|uniref:Uncharacterized protein n=1 Tax=Colletotrichum orbiculare (strain 104-T / ATCC 96160 / CBS 514.97 / LARS 414 / MAFF 240422) TaxID=1213857 RepID=A0A484G5Z7_COLOR|nr:hypothetical protein Cob_v002116 [Colletotrichum orbiculare MAFF 240422]
MNLLRLQQENTTSTSPSRDISPASPPRDAPENETRTNHHRSSSSSPPATPRPWLWRCHACGTRFRLACTRRCLRCGHMMCTRPPPSPSLIRASRQQQQRRRRTCLMEFDYAAWAAWGMWRRRTTTTKGTATGEVEDLDPWRGEEVTSPLALSPRMLAAKSNLSLDMDEADPVFGTGLFAQNQVAAEDVDPALELDMFKDAAREDEWDEWWDCEGSYCSPKDGDENDLGNVKRQYP